MKIAENFPDRYRNLDPLEAHPDSHETEVLKAMFAINIPLMRALQHEYGSQRGWSVCGPDAILRGRFVSAITGVPFRRGGTDEHLEIILGLKHYTFGKGIEHACLRYASGQRDETLLFDGVGDLLWGGHDDPNNALDVKVCTSSKLWWDLLEIEEDYYEYTPEQAGLLDVDIWRNQHPTTAVEYDDHLAIMHQDQVYNNHVVAPSGRQYDVSGYWGDHLIGVTEAVFAVLPPGMIDSIDKLLIMDEPHSS